MPVEPGGVLVKDRGLFRDEADETVPHGFGLFRRPFRAETLESDLEEITRSFLSDSAKGLLIDEKSRTMHASMLFHWFADDFAERGGITGFAAPYFSPQKRRWLQRHARELSVVWMPYDWRLNR